jgi:hypothetical protein
LFLSFLLSNIATIPLGLLSCFGLSLCTT